VFKPLRTPLSARGLPEPRCMPLGEETLLDLAEKLLDLERPLLSLGTGAGFGAPTEFFCPSADSALLEEW
jgi:hypothetical protein